MEQIKDLLNMLDRMNEHNIIQQYHDLDYVEKDVLERIGIARNNLVNEVRQYHLVNGTETIRGLIKNFLEEVED